MCMGNVFNTLLWGHPLIPESACGTCPFEARLFILGLTSVVCHFFRVFMEMHMTACDVRVTRQPNGVI